jgi:tRNA(Ile)-lysidine synthase
MRLARGTGLSGLAGMRARRGAWLKPCLGASRAEIEADLRAHRIAWREDASNAEPTWLRNRIRHVAVPALLDALGIAPAPASARRAGLARRVGTLADELARADHLLERLAARALRAAGSDVTRTGAGSGATSVRALARWPEAVRRRALFRAWRVRVGRGGPGLTSRHLQALARSVQARAGDGDGQRASIDLPGGWTFRVARGMVHFAPPEPTGGRSERDIRRSGAADARLARGRSRPGRGPTARSPARRRVPRAIA